jgi:outer membrane protein assembly factor BamB
VVAIPDAFVFGIDAASGALRWRFHPKHTGFSWFASSDQTTIYAGSGDGRVFAIDAASGSARWGVRIADDSGGAAFSPVVFSDTIYVGYLRRTTPRTGGIGAIDARTGARLWYTEFIHGASRSASSSHGNVAIVNDVIIAASDGGEIYALKRATGAVVWQAPRVPLPAMTIDDDRPVAASGQIVLAGSSGGTVTAYVGSTGKLLWQRTLEGSVTSPIATDENRAFIVDLSGRIVAIDVAMGNIAWAFGGSVSRYGAILSAPIVRGNVVYVGGEKASYALRAHAPTTRDTGAQPSVERHGHLAGKGTGDGN